MFLKPNDPLAVTTIDGKNFILAAPLEFRLENGMLLRARVGATTDGLSSPKFVKCDLQTDVTFFPAVAHDAAYRGDLEQSLDNGETWEPVQLSKQEADYMLLELCEANMVPEIEGRMIEAAVVEFGRASWDADAPLRDSRKGVTDQAAVRNADSDAGGSKSDATAAAVTDQSQKPPAPSPVICQKCQKVLVPDSPTNCRC